MDVILVDGPSADLVARNTAFAHEFVHGEESVRRDEFVDSQFCALASYVQLFPQRLADICAFWKACDDFGWRLSEIGDLSNHDVWNTSGVEAPGRFRETFCQRVPARGAGNDNQVVLIGRDHLSQEILDIGRAIGRVGLRIAKNGWAGRA